MQDDFTDIQKLLRLKRYEQPGPEYFDSFLSEFQRRQRSELIRTPLWRIASDRVTAFFADFQVPRLAYAGAFSAVALAVVAAVSQLNNNSHTAGTFASAEASSSQPERLVALSPNSRIELPSVDAFKPVSLPSSSSTRYVLETRPVSYAAPYSF